MSDSGRIWLISGVPGAGKTTVAQAICARFPRAVHVPVDDLRDFVVSGFASPLEVAATPEMRLQFRLARRSAALMAALYADEGFVVVIDDVVHPEHVDESYVTHLTRHRLRRVALVPSLEVALERNRKRTTKWFAPEVLEGTIRDLHPTLFKDLTGWIVIDNSELSAQETADRILGAERD